MGEYVQPLAHAFWLAVIADLARGLLECRLWLDTGASLGGFLWWCELTSKDQRSWHALLMRVWAARGTEQGARIVRIVEEQL